MVAMTRTCSPSQPDGSVSVTLISFNIQSGRNGGLEAALRAMDQLGVDIGFLVETKLTGGIYTWHSLGYDVLALTATSSSSGGIALFWRSNTSYKVKETQIWGPNVISLHLMMGSTKFFVMGCYIPPSDLETLACINKAWRECPKDAHPILVGDLNLNLQAPRTEREETIAKQVDAMNLVNMSRHFCQRSGNRLRGRWTWWMRREGRWISSQCDYFLGRETNRRRFWRVSVRMPRYHSNHHALVAVIYAEGGEELKRYHRRMQRFPLSLPRGPRTQLDAGYEELLQHVVYPPPRERSANKWITEAT
jgi:exonuclease III